MKTLLLLEVLGLKNYRLVGTAGPVAMLNSALYPLGEEKQNFGFCCGMRPSDMSNNKGKKVWLLCVNSQEHIALSG